MMACYSRIVTKLTDHERLRDALEAEGYTAKIGGNGLAVVGTKEGLYISFGRNSTGDQFVVGGDTSDLRAVSRRYAEIGVRRFAERRGYTVAENDGRTMTLVNRRG